LGFLPRRRGERGGGFGECETFDALAKQVNIEINQETDGQPGEAKVGKELGFVDRLHSPDGLKFDQNGIFNHEVETVSSVELKAFVSDRQRLLPGYVQSEKRQFVSKACLVRGFEQTGAKVSMHFNRGSDDLFREVFLLEFHFSASSAPLR
jgi:hypothetical protein